ncbi:MAG: DUF488 domain-containing protein [Mariniphaga sp.]
MKFFTKGVYHSEEEDFFEKLTANGIDAFADIRQRRGVRGARYSFVNRRRLQQKLQDLGIRYEHIPGLAPTPEIRMLQEMSDKQQKKSKKERKQLSGAFVQAFKNDILARFDLDNFIQQQKEQGAEKIVFFCVEEFPEACHRSIVADQLTAMGYNVTHL